MDQSNFNTIEDVRKSGSHLSLEERGMVQALHRQGLSLLRIIAEIGCAHTTTYFIPKGMTIERFTDEDILNMADELNQRPRRILGYHSPTELFDMFLDEVYSIYNVS